ESGSSLVFNSETISDNFCSTLSSVCFPIFRETIEIHSLKTAKYASMRSLCVSLKNLPFLEYLETAITPIILPFDFNGKREKRSPKSLLGALLNKYLEKSSSALKCRKELSAETT